MSGVCLDKLPHSCGTRKGLQVFAGEDGNVNGYCFACGTYIPNPYGDPKPNDELPQPEEKTQAELDEELAEVGSYPSVDVPQRKLRASVLEEFGVRTSLSEEDGKTPTAMYYPCISKGKVTGYKVKTLDGSKMFFAIGSIKNAEPFGWQRALSLGTKKLIITEGEDDALALTRIIERNTKKDYKDYMPAVISLPNGAGSAPKYLDKWKGEIWKNFREVVLCFDMDDVGQDAVKKTLGVLPEAKVASLPDKDANDCLINGHSRAAFNAVTFNASVPKNSKLVFGTDLHEAARQEAVWGDLTWPWPSLNETTRGIRYGETVYIGAGVKMGKSEIVNALAAHFIKEHEVKIFMAKPEEANVKSYKLLAGKIVGRKFHDPKVDFDYEAYDKAGEILKEKMATINLYQHLGWETLKSDIVSAVNWGAKAVFIDPITNLTNGIDAGEANSKLQEIAQELSAMALDYNIVIFIFCHLKSHEGNITKEKREKFYHDGKYIGLGNCPHEYGGDIYSSQFAGSRAMMRSCNYMIGLEGNKDDNLSNEIRNVRHLKLLEDREFGETGVFPLYWNSETTLFREC